MDTPYAHHMTSMFIKPSTAFLARLDKVFTTRRTQFKNKNIDQMFKSLVGSANKHAQNQVQKLYMEGKSIGSISNEVAQSFGLGGKGKQVRARARAFFNTSVSIAREDVRTEAESKYHSELKGWMFDAHMDNRTTPYCRDHEETFYPIEKYPSREALAAKAGVYVPAHFNCRSVIIPIPKEDMGWTAWEKVSEKVKANGDGTETVTEVWERTKI